MASECVNNAEDVCSIKMVENSKLELNGLVKPKIKCEECDFITISTVKLKLHSRCVHAKQKDINEKFLRQKYDYTKHYWETGRIGISYQSYLQVLFLVDACLPRYEQVIEKDLLYEARKKQFGENYWSYPPWCNK